MHPKFARTYFKQVCNAHPTLASGNTFARIGMHPELVASSLWREGRAGLEGIARANIIPPIGDAALLAASNLEINVWAVRRRTLQ